MSDTMNDTPQMKHRLDDFLVRENVVVELTERVKAKYEYLTLRKRGFTTMESVRRVANKLDVPASQVTYHGLKDEDGVTEQLIAVPVGQKAHGVCIEEDGRFLELQHYGYGRIPLKIGRLEGNSFRITVRNLAQATANALAARSEVNLFFLNYYDTQRFGVLNGPKCTHLLGKDILEGNYQDALVRLIELGTPESEQALQWNGKSRDFFLQLDSRVPTFYLSSYSSYLFNKALCEIVEAACPNQLIPIELEGLRYRFVSSPDAVVAVMASTRQLPVQRYRFMDNKPHESIRSTVTQTKVKVDECLQDEANPGRCRLVVRFALPSGCYATTAIRQMLQFATCDGDL